MIALATTITASLWIAAFVGLPVVAFYEGR